MSELPRFERGVSQEKLWAAIDEAGGVIVERFLDDDLLARLREDFAPKISDHPPGASHANDFWQDFHGTATKRITGLAGVSDAWVELLCDPVYEGLGDHYLTGDDYYLNTGQLICIGPGETPQLLHRDELNWPGAAGQPHEITITAIFALTDFTASNGATVIAPGSHLWPETMPDVRPDQCRQAIMPAGSALLYSGKVIHGGGANETTDEWRVALHAGFVRGWLRSEENHQLTTTLEAARRMPERVQRLLGFRSYEQPFGGRLGLVDYDDAAQLL